MKCKYTKVLIKDSTKKEKKLMAVFHDKNGKAVKTIHFGAKGYSDYTIHKDPKRKERYISRHRSREDWERCDTAGSLSRFVLWGYPSLSKSIKDYKRRFRLI